MDQGVTLPSVEMELTTGERFSVRHPERLLVGRTSCHLVSYDGDLVEQMHHVGLRHIVRITPLNGKQTGATRAGRKSR